MSFYEIPNIKVRQKYYTSFIIENMFIQFFIEYVIIH